MIFAFVFAFDSDSLVGAPRPDPERMRRIYMGRPYLPRPGARTSGRRAKDKGENGFRLKAGMTIKTVEPSPQAGHICPTYHAALIFRRPNAGRMICGPYG